MRKLSFLFFGLFYSFSVQAISLYGVGAELINNESERNETAGIFSTFQEISKREEDLTRKESLIGFEENKMAEIGFEMKKWKKLSSEFKDLKRERDKLIEKIEKSEIEKSDDFEELRKEEENIENKF